MTEQKKILLEAREACRKVLTDEPVGIPGLNSSMIRACESLDEAISHRIGADGKEREEE